jgi:tetratricopeptide (TPR) repeat protein
MNLRRPLVVFLIALFAIAGCGKKEISSLDRKKAAALASEADFAVTLRDFTRAEGLFAQATALCPDAGDYWLNLGSMRMRLGQRATAKTAYRQALSAYENAAKKDKADVEAALQQVYVLALLGRTADAQALLAKLPERYPNERQVRSFVETKQLDRMLADPKFKELAL